MKLEINIKKRKKNNENKENLEKLCYICGKNSDENNILTCDR